LNVLARTIRRMASRKLRHFYALEEDSPHYGQCLVAHECDATGQLLSPGQLSPEEAEVVLDEYFRFSLEVSSSKCSVYLIEERVGEMGGRRLCEVASFPEALDAAWRYRPNSPDEHSKGPKAVGLIVLNRCGTFQVVSIGGSETSSESEAPSDPETSGESEAQSKPETHSGSPAPEAGLRLTDLEEVLGFSL